MRSVVLRVTLALALCAPALHSESSMSARAAVPDFSGRWKIDMAKSTRLAQQAKQMATIVFGDECVITQTAEALTLYIVAGGLKVEATYRLDGQPSVNRSPGPPGQPDISIVSTTRWVGETLEITTKSESELRGVKVPVQSLRRMWLTAEGDLAVERHGAPVEVVSDAWSVYNRVKGEQRIKVEPRAHQR